MSLLVMKRALVVMVLVFAALAVAGCRSSGGDKSCHNPKPYSKALTNPTLKIPEGLQTPDTRNALRIPDLKEPEPPARRATDPCLDEPPKYVAPPSPRPQA